MNNLLGVKNISPRKKVRKDMQYTMQNSCRVIKCQNSTIIYAKHAIN